MRDPGGSVKGKVGDPSPKFRACDEDVDLEVIHREVVVETTTESKIMAGRGRENRWAKGESLGALTPQ